MKIEEKGYRDLAGELRRQILAELARPDLVGEPGVVQIPPFAIVVASMLNLLHAQVCIREEFDRIALALFGLDHGTFEDCWRVNPARRAVFFSGVTLDVKATRRIIAIQG